ncbi:MAG: GNAT family N-acetyltransferase [Gemmatimonadaceae bacterium]
MAIVIRRASAADAIAVGNLAKEFQDFLRSLDPAADFDWGASQYLRDGFRDNPAFEGFVAEEKSVVVAFALFHPGYDTDRGERGFYMTDLFVSSTHRGRSVGKRLMQRIAEVGCERGVSWLAWSVFKGNAPAVKFYEALGATYIDKLHQMYIAMDALRQTA